MDRRAPSSSAMNGTTVKAVPSADFSEAFESAAITSVGCLGAGRIGVCTMAMMAKKMPDVNFTVYDDDPRVVCACQVGPLHFYEPAMDELVSGLRGKNLFFTSSLEQTVTSSQVIFVSLSTPLKSSGIGSGQAADLSTWDNAARRIARAAKGCCKIVVECSTIPITTGETMRKVLDALAPGVFEVLCFPSFFRGGSALSFFENPDRALLGAADTPQGRIASEAMVRLLSPWIPSDRIIPSNLWSAELSKLAQNAIIAQRITSVNAVSALCERTGADLDEVMKVVSMDTRISKGYLQACPGIGGATLMQNVKMLIYLCKHMRLNEVADYWEQVLTMDLYQRTRFCNNIEQTMGTLKSSKVFCRVWEKAWSILACDGGAMGEGRVQGKRIAILGFAYKADTSEIVESPALGLCKSLLLDGARLAIYDPQVADESIMTALEGVPPMQLSICPSAMEALTGAHALVLVTGWSEFAGLDMGAVLRVMEAPAFVFDSRAVFDPDELSDLGFRVYRIGRPRRGPD